MKLPRSVLPETLDHLPESDPRAMRSRRDLQRIHRFMGTRTILGNALRDAIPAPRRIIELGAGDGTLMLGFAKTFSKLWPAVHLTLLDRQNLVNIKTLDAFHDLGWHAEPLNIDVTNWLGQPAEPEAAHYDLAIANLFIHHFDGAALDKLLHGVALRSDTFLACEPRRSRLALLGSHLVGLIGANDVTREDAVLSVHAGYADQELSALWPNERPGWQLREHAAGLFSHCFLATRQTG